MIKHHAGIPRTEIRVFDADGEEWLRGAPLEDGETFFERDGKKGLFPGKRENCRRLTGTADEGPEVCAIGRDFRVIDRIRPLGDDPIDRGPARESCRAVVSGFGSAGRNSLSQE